jgi:hypothetical protein
MPSVVAYELRPNVTEDPVTSPTAATAPVEPNPGGTARPRPERLPLNTFAIGFGLAGLAEVWTYARPALELPRGVPQASGRSRQWRGAG